jgi:hypothetical protein
LLHVASLRPVTGRAHIKYRDVRPRSTVHPVSRRSPTLLARSACSEQHRYRVYVARSAWVGRWTGNARASMKAGLAARDSRHLGFASCASITTRGSVPRNQKTAGVSHLPSFDD